MPIVTRGRVTNARTKQYTQFAVNPAEIKIKTGVHFVEDAIPGFSHPKRRAVSGESEVYTFDLNLDGFMSQDTFGVTFQNDAKPVDPDSPYSIQGELDYWESFNLPPWDLVVFTFGSRFPGILCDIAVSAVDVLEFDYNLNPMRAKLQIALAKYVTKSEQASQRWSYGA